MILVMILASSCSIKGLTIFDITLFNKGRRCAGNGKESYLTEFDHYLAALVDDFRDGMAVQRGPDGNVRSPIGVERMHLRGLVPADDADVGSRPRQLVPGAARFVLLQAQVTAGTASQGDDLAFVFPGDEHILVQVHKAVPGEVLPILAVGHVSNLVRCHAGLPDSPLDAPVGVTVHPEVDARALDVVRKVYGESALQTRALELRGDQQAARDMVRHYDLAGGLALQDGLPDEGEVPLVEGVVGRGRQELAPGMDELEVTHPGLEREPHLHRDVRP